MSDKKIRIIVVDDHEFVRAMLGVLLKNNPNYDLIANGESGEDAIDLVKKYHPDVLLLDFSMPGCGGLEAARQILGGKNRTKIIMVSSFRNVPFPLRLIALGAHGYLHKGASKEVLFKAIDTVLQDQVYLDPAVAEEITQGKNSPFAKLNDRELQIALLLIQEISIQTIAEYFNIDVKTALIYRYNIYHTLGLELEQDLSNLAKASHLFSQIVTPFQ